MDITYKILSNFYDLIDVVYFKKNDKNPREAILKCIGNGKIKILDMCAGTASNSILIGKNKTNANVIGIDISKDMLSIGKEKILRQNINNVELLERNACATQFDDNSFDFVIIALVLHEVDTKLADNILEEVHRILKRDGNLIVLEWEQPHKLFKRFLFLLIKILEPKPFKKFFKMDKDEYFRKHDFIVINKIHCDYSCVYKLTIEN